MTLLVTIVCAVVPFVPSFPQDGLDPSWAIATNQAAVQHLSFGKEFIFTYGPYGSIITRLYHPKLDSLILIASTFLAISTWISLFILTKSNSWWWALAFHGVFAASLCPPETLLFAYPLLAAFAAHQLSTTEGTQLSIRSHVIVAILFASLGLVPLIKASTVAFCGLISLSCAILFQLRKQKIWVGLCLTTPILTMSLFWLLVGQPLFSLPRYFLSMRGIISGYTEAMAFDGPSREIHVYLFASLLIMSATLLGLYRNRTTCIFSTVVLLAYLYINFKNGFVRHDAHALRAAYALIIAALTMAIVAPATLPIYIASLLGWLYIDSHYQNTSSKQIIENSWSNYSSVASGLQLRRKHHHELKARFKNALATIHDKYRFQPLPGTTDIYSFEQAYLLASTNRWNPRPIMQSYAAYTPELAEKNLAHLLGPTAPNNILFRVQTIDNRLPSLDDGATWPILLEHYRPLLERKDFIYLRRTDTSPAPPKFQPLLKGIYTIGQSIEVPLTHQLIFAKFKLRPTLRGRLANLGLKSSTLQIGLELENGQRKEYRILSGMAEGPFLLSPHTTDTNEFSTLYQGSHAWRNREVELLSFPFSPKLAGLGDSAPQLPRDMSQAQLDISMTCSGSIESVNGVVSPFKNATIFGTLTVTGQLEPSSSQSETTRADLLVFTDQHGVHTYFDTIPQSSPNEASTHNTNPYVATVALSMLHGGKYTLGLAKLHDGKVTLCTKSSLPLQVRGINEHAQ